MSKKLEELLDLPDSKEIIKQEKDKEKHEVIQQQNDTLRDIAEMDKISAALPQVKGLGEMADKELNEVAEKSMEAYEKEVEQSKNETKFSATLVGSDVDQPLKLKKEQQKESPEVRHKVLVEKVLLLVSHMLIIKRFPLISTIK